MSKPKSNIKTSTIYSKVILNLLFFLFCAASNYAQTGSPDSLVHREVKARTTDAAIAFELQNHQVFYNPDCVQKDKLLLHMVGTIDNPASTSLFPSLAANNGFKAISLKYPNSVSGTSACSGSSDVDCHWKYHEEVVYGTDTSSGVSVDSTNSIINRFTKLLIYLKNTYPSENWGQYLTGSNTINWADIVLSGHSQGGGHAAFIAKKYAVERVLTFASPNEYSGFFNAPATWVNLPSATAGSNYFAFCNRFDEVVDFSKQYAVHQVLNMNSPIDSFNIDGQACPFGKAQILYTDAISLVGIAPNHNSVVIDNFTPDGSGATAGKPLFTPVWEYMLGLCGNPNSVSTLEQKVEIIAYPNPGNGAVHLRSSEIIASIAVYNSVGLLVHQAAPRNTKYQFTLSAKGLLLVHVEFEDGSRKVLRVINNSSN